MEDRIQKFKRGLAAVFDDNLHTKQWHNIVDWVIISMILLSTVEIFISTFDVSPGLKHVLQAVDCFVLVFFTVEVTLRIWVAPELDPKYSGIIGRLRYCFSFYGFIDIVSTYPFYLQWLIPFPAAWLRTFRTFRIIRLFRISRYMKSWRLLVNTFHEKKNELVVSMQFLLVITLILSLMLFFCEHDAQPENYDNGFSSVLWAFGQYIGDPGGFAENPPITPLGKVIASIVGLLGIAIVAVPAGILGAGFTESIEHERDGIKLKANQQKLLGMFQRKLDRPTGFQAVSFFQSFANIQARTGMSEDDIIETAEQTVGMRVINLAATIPVQNQPTDRLAIEHFPVNRSYGVCIDRGSKVTIISSSSLVDATGGIFAFYVAFMGGFNFISRELGGRIEYTPTYTFRDDVDYIDSDREFFSDLQQLMNRPGAWSFDIFPSSGANELEYDTQFHFGIGNEKGVEAMEGDDLIIRDIARYKQFYETFATVMKDKFGLLTDNGKHHSTAIKTMWRRRLDVPEDVNAVVLRTAWSAMLWNDKRLLIAKTIADTINQVILGKTDVPVPAVLKQKDIGYKGYEIPEYKESI